jgi:hypothetical protein
MKSSIFKYFFATIFAGLCGVLYQTILKESPTDQFLQILDFQKDQIKNQSGKNILDRSIRMKSFEQSSEPDDIEIPTSYQQFDQPVGHVPAVKTQKASVISVDPNAASSSIDKSSGSIFAQGPIEQGHQMGVEQNPYNQNPYNNDFYYPPQNYESSPTQHTKGPQKFEESAKKEEPQQIMSRPADVQKYEKEKYENNPFRHARSYRDQRRDRVDDHQPNFIPPVNPELVSSDTPPVDPTKDPLWKKVLPWFSLPSLVVPIWKWWKGPIEKPANNSDDKIRHTYDTGYMPRPLKPTFPEEPKQPMPKQPEASPSDSPGPSAEKPEPIMIHQPEKPSFTPLELSKNAKLLADPINSANLPRKNPHFTLPENSFVRLQPSAAISPGLFQKTKVLNFVQSVPRNAIPTMSYQSLYDRARKFLGQTQKAELLPASVEIVKPADVTISSSTTVEAVKPQMLQPATTPTVIDQPKVASALSKNLYYWGLKGLAVALQAGMTAAVFKQAYNAQIAADQLGIDNALDKVVMRIRPLQLPTFQNQPPPQPMVAGNYNPAAVAQIAKAIKFIP